MMNVKRLFLTGMLLLCVAPLYAQQFSASNKAPAYKAERQLLESTIQTIVTVIQEATVHNQSSGLGDRLRDITSQLARAANLMSPTPDATAAAVTQDDLESLRRMLLDIAQQLESIRDELDKQESHDLANRMRDVESDVRHAVRTVDHLAEAEDESNVVTTEDGERWLRPGRYDDTRGDDADRDTRVAVRDRDDDNGDTYDDGDYADDTYTYRRYDKDRRRRHYDPFDWHHYSGAFVGEYSYRWPYRRETALYNSIPSIRYNRVEGFVAGVGRQPLEWNDYGRATIYGQVGYAFGLDDWRGTIGAETRIDNRRRDDFGLKVGAAYRYNTDSRDSWKTSWLENSLAAFFFENDFFDYYQVEGWTLYAVQRLTPYLQLSAGYRNEDYTSLTKNTGWSLFGGDGFSENPAIDEGNMHSFVFAFEGGRVVGLQSLPRGAAFRFEAEVGSGLGGDFDFNRYVADGRVYLPMTRYSSLGLRLRGGVTEGDLTPLQKQFTLGGIGSVRAYPQNLFLGTRMLLANAEYVVDGIDFFGDWLDDLQLIGFADMGWVNTFDNNAFNFDDVIPSAGFGIGLDDRAVRLELAFPLRDMGTGMDPSLWLRITPNF